MTKIISLFKTFSTDDSGAALIEYSILIGLIAALVLALVMWTGGWVQWAWQQLTNALATTAYGVALP